MLLYITMNKNNKKIVLVIALCIINEPFDIKVFDKDNLHDWPLNKDLEINKGYFIVTPPLFEKLKNKYGFSDNA